MNPSSSSSSFRFLRNLRQSSLWARLTREQRAILVALKTSHVVVDAVAGSGKTSTIEAIHAAFPAANILTILFNTVNKYELRKKEEAIARRGRSEIHTYNSYCWNYYHTLAAQDRSDRMIYEALERIEEEEGATSISSPSFPFDLIILDESQDLTPMYTAMIQHILATHPGAHILILGDRYQWINKWRDASNEYMIQPEGYFRNDAPASSSLPFKHLKLSISHRVPKEIAAFVNWFVGEKRIRSSREGGQVQYHIGDYDAAIDYILHLSSQGFHPDDIFILSYTARPGNPWVDTVADAITEHLGWPIHRPTSEDMALDPICMEHKIVLSSFHQAKGLERKIVLILNFDDSCPSDVETLYVGLTRAQDRLVVFHHEERGYLPLVAARADELLPWKRTTLLEPTPAARRGPRDKMPLFQVTALVRHLSFERTNRILTHYIQKTIVQPAEERIELPTKAEFPGWKGVAAMPQTTKERSDVKGGSILLHEPVSDIVAIAIHLLYQWFTIGNIVIIAHDSCELRDAIEQWKKDWQGIAAKEGEARPHDPYFRDSKYTPRFLSSFLHGLIHILSHDQPGSKWREVQIQDTKWFTSQWKNIRRVLDRLDAMNVWPTADRRVEHEIPVWLPTEDANITGRIDCRVEMTLPPRVLLYEWKCVDVLSDEHVLQTAIYAAMRMIAAPNPPFETFLYNMATNECVRIEVARPAAMMQELIRWKLKK